VFLTALRAGLRRGELVALPWGDIQFGKDESDSNRFMIVQHNYVRREHTTTKSKRSRRVDLSRELRRALIELRDKRLLEAFLKGKNDIADDLVFRSPDGAIVDPDNLTIGFSCLSSRRRGSARSGFTISGIRLALY